MKNYIIGSVLLTATLFVGCNSDGGECCGTGNLVGLGAEVIPPKGPVAIFDGNWTTEKESKSQGSFSSAGDVQQLGENSGNEVINFIFNCNSSYNLDDANISIQNCNWTFFDTANCIDKNSSAGSVVNLKYTCGGSIIDGNLTAILEVTDELNQTAESNATLKIKRTGDADIAKVSLVYK